MLLMMKDSGVLMTKGPGFMNDKSIRLPMNTNSFPNTIRNYILFSPNVNWQKSPIVYEN